jgi:hypothetical protein
MFDSYLINKCAEAFKKMAKAEPVYLYHGTRANRLSSILSQGLLPNPKERVWKEDPDASWLSPSRQSLSGIYLTSNLMTAISSARNAGKKQYNPVIIMVSVQPQSLVMDEDNINPESLPHPTVSLNANEPLVSQIYFSQFENAHPYTISKGKEFFDDAQKEYIKHVIKRIEYDMKSEIHPNLKEHLERLLFDGFVIALNRKIAHITPDYYKRLWGNWTDRENYNNAPKRPTVAEAEREFKDYEDKLTRALRVVVLKSLKEDYRFTARILEPIGYSKSNRIIAVFELVKNENDKYTDDLIQVYPKGKPAPEEALEKLEKDWRANISSSNFNIKQ